MSVNTRTAFVALGSNLGDRDATLESALFALDAEPGVTVAAVSGFHTTTPVGGPLDQDDYLNAVVRLAVQRTPEELLEVLMRIEAEHGRDRSNAVSNGPRTLDLDLLWVARESAHVSQTGSMGEERATAALSLPHPRMEERLFVLEPLAEIAPGFVLPISGVPVRARIDALRLEEVAR